MATLAARIFPMLTQLLRGRGQEAGPVTLNRHRIYILPTRQGVLFGVFLLAMLIGSINYGLSLGFVLTFLLGGISTVAILHTYKNLQGMKISDGGATPAYAGQDALFHLLLEAPAPRPALQAGWRKHRAVRFDLDGTQRIAIPVPAPQRGLLRPGRFTLSTIYPLGLFRAWAYVQFNQSALIYPTPGDTPLRSTRTGESGASAHIGTREGSEDFAGLRAWQPGDSPRQVAWKVAARSDELATKRFHDTEGGQVMLDWDALPGLDMEARLSQLTRWVLDAEAMQLRYGLKLPGTLLAPDQGPLHQRRCLEALALHGLPTHD